MTIRAEGRKGKTCRHRNKPASRGVWLLTDVSTCEDVEIVSTETSSVPVEEVKRPKKSVS